MRCSRASRASRACPGGGDSRNGSIDQAECVHHNGNGVAHDDHGARRRASPSRSSAVESRSTCHATRPIPTTAASSGRAERGRNWGSDHRPTIDAMLSFQDTMQAFLRTQQEVMRPISASRSMTSYAPWNDQVSETPNRIRSAASTRPPHPASPGPGPAKFAGWSPAPRSRRSSSSTAHDDPIAQHHTLGGRKISALDPSLLGLPVLPFAVMAEMTAQVAALVVDPGLVLTGLQAGSSPQVGALRGSSRSTSSCAGSACRQPDDDRVWVGIFNRGTDGKAEAPRTGFRGGRGLRRIGSGRAAGRCLVAGECPSQQVHGPFGLRRAMAVPWPALPGHRPHGQAVRNRESRDACECSRSSRWSRTGKPTTFHTDLVVIDNFTQLLGAGASTISPKGTSCFRSAWKSWRSTANVRLSAPKSLARSRSTSSSGTAFAFEAQFVRPDGTVWMRINDWEDWRFHWPGRYRDSFRQPRDYLVGEELPLADPAMTTCRRQSGLARAPGRHGPAGLARRAGTHSARARGTRGLSGCSGSRRAAVAAALGPDRGQGGRPAALERRRRSADLSGRPGDRRRRARPAPADARWRARGMKRCRPSRSHMPMVSPSPWPRSIRPPGWESTWNRSSSAPPSFRCHGVHGRQSERSWIAGRARVAPSGSARFWCAKEAAAKASGLGLAGGPAAAEVVEVHEDTGVIHVRLAPELRDSLAEMDVPENPLRVVSARRGRARLGLDHWKRNQTVISVPSRTEILDDVIDGPRARPRGAVIEPDRPKTLASSPTSAWRRSTPSS